ncbi:MULTISPECIES: serine/threonine-protein kinase [unclassified Microcoleus]|uniref:serine/threonine-protein kinase n=1 Tax=unclassified Microcoleus TaxID=2642155 RepID=UPI002FCF5F5E
MSGWQRGEKLNNSKYTIERELGKGGFGITYLAKDSTGKEVVIKTLNANVQKRPDFNEFQKRFLDEAQRLRKYQHKNIVKFYDLFLEERLWCIAMEYIKGENLADLVRKKGVLSLSVGLEYIRQVGDALAFAHSQGMLHRDVKPENIVLKNQLEVVLIDFGIAREFTPNQTNSLTQFLSEGYAPLEQYYRRHTPGNYTDVYALAATLYVLLTGYIQGGYEHRLPRSIDRDDSIKNFKKDLLVPPNQINKNLSNWINLAILKGLEIHPKNRPQTVEEWLEFLQPNLTISQQLQLSYTGVKSLSQTAVTNFIQNPSI